jgi:hypothetical protein
MMMPNSYKQSHDTYNPTNTVVIGAALLLIILAGFKVNDYMHKQEISNDPKSMIGKTYKCVRGDVPSASDAKDLLGLIIAVKAVDAEGGGGMQGVGHVLAAGVGHDSRLRRFHGRSHSIDGEKMSSPGPLLVSVLNVDTSAPSVALVQVRVLTKKEVGKTLWIRLQDIDLRAGEVKDITHP